MKKKAVFIQQGNEDDIVTFHLPTIYQRNPFRLTLNTSLGILSLVELREGALPRMLLEAYFSAGETRILFPLLSHQQAQTSAYPQYAPHSVLYAHWYANGRPVTDEMIQWGHDRIQSALEAGILQTEVRVLRNTMTRIREKIGDFGMDVLPVLSRGYLLTGTGEVCPAADGIIRHIEALGRPDSVITTHTKLGTVTLMEPNRMIQRLLSIGEYRVFLALIDAMPMVCPNEVLLANYTNTDGPVTLDEIDAAHTRLAAAAKAGEGEFVRAMRGVYSAVHDLRKKLEKLDLTIALKTGVGYKLTFEETGGPSKPLSSSQIETE